MISKWAALSTIITFVCLTACVQTENSSSDDIATYLVGTGTVNFINAKLVIAFRCSACHNYSSLTEQQMITTGLVVPGNLAASKIYYRLVGANVGPGPRDMPTGSSLTGSELEIMENWIRDLNP